jgi:hypothetical protein
MIVVLMGLCLEENRIDLCNIKYRRTPVSAGNTFQDVPRLRETADNTERYIRGEFKK